MQPLATNQVAALIGTSPKQLESLVRFNRVATPPRERGRFAWGAEHILAAARVLGLDTPELRNMLNGETSLAVGLPLGTGTARSGCPHCGNRSSEPVDFKNLHKRRCRFCRGLFTYSTQAAGRTQEVR